MITLETIQVFTIMTIYYFCVFCRKYIPSWSNCALLKVPEKIEIL